MATPITTQGEVQDREVVGRGEQDHPGGAEERAAGQHDPGVMSSESGGDSGCGYTGDQEPDGEGAGDD